LDSNEGIRLGHTVPRPAAGPAEDEQAEPWAWRDKRMPRHVRRRLKLYAAWVKGLGYRDDDQ